MIDAAETLLIQAEIAALPRMDAWLTAFAAAHCLAPAITEELRVCLHELAGNVIMHGGGATRQIALSARLEAGRAVLEFADDAPAFNPLSRPTGPVSGALEDVAIGGLGLHLVRSFTDSLEYQYHAGWNRLTLRKAVH